jgi:hypothetical protein
MRFPIHTQQEIFPEKLEEEREHQERKGRKFPLTLSAPSSTYR